MFRLLFTMLLVLVPEIATAEVEKPDEKTSQAAVAELKAYLQQPAGDRPELGKQSFAKVSLTRADAAQAQAILWNDHVAAIRKSRAGEMQQRVLTDGKLSMPFFYTVTGEKPKSGRSLYISLHGGGGASARLNDSQYENQKRLYKVPEGVYLAPRAPTNTWDLWHQPHIDRLFDRLIENLIVFEEVDPNRVYVMGYSAGGDGVYRLGPRMADRWAAASMMAGHPGEVSPLNLRNTPFTIHVGGKDAAYKRNEHARAWKQKLADLHTDDPAGYVHWAKVYESKAHWLDREDAAAVPWMAKFTRNPLPTHIVWRQDSHRRFYWLAVPELQPGVVVKASCKKQTIEIEATGLKTLAVRCNDALLNMDADVTISHAGTELFKGHVPRTIGTLAVTLAERGDPASVFSGEVLVTFPEATP